MILWQQVSMDWSLFDAKGQRKYLTPAQRAAFIAAALRVDPNTCSFCLTLALTGARISEVLALSPQSDKEMAWARKN
jgi:integrase